MRVMILVALLILTGCEYSYKWGTPKDPTSDQTGRYVINQNESGLFMLDTATGNSWKWVFYVDNKDETKKISGYFWEPQMRFRTMDTSEQYINLLQAEADLARYGTAK